MFSLLKQKNNKKIVYFTHGALGDMLMGFHLLSCVDSSKISQRIILIRKNANLARQIAELYNNQIQVQVLDWRYFFSGSFYKVYFIFGPSFSKFITKVSIFIFYIFCRGGYPVLFSYKKNLRILEQLMSFRVYSFDKEKLFIENLFQSIKPFSKNNTFNPVLIPYKNNSLRERQIIIHPFAASKKRTFSLDRWREIVEIISKTFPDYKIIITMFGNEKVYKSYFDGFNNVSFLEDSSIDNLLCVLSHGALYIGVDTGTTHLASMTQIPVVCIANGSNPTWHPLYSSKSIVILNKENCTCGGDKTGNCIVVHDGQEYYRCLYEISNQVIIDAVTQQIHFFGK